MGEDGGAKPADVKATSPEPRPELGAGRAVVVTALVVVAVNFVVTVATVELPSDAVRIRGLYLLYETGHHLAAAFIANALIGVWARFGTSRGGAPYLAVGVVAVALGTALLRQDTAHFAERVAPGGLARPVEAGAFVLVGALIAGAAWLGRSSKSRERRIVLGAAAVVVLAANHLVLQNDYSGAHFAVAVAAAVLLAATLSGVPLPAWWSRARTVAPIAFAALFASWTLIVWPSNAVLVELLRADGSVVTPLLSRARDRSPSLGADVPAATRPWLARRADAPDVPSSGTKVLPDDGLVLLLSVDALRADVVLSKEHDAKLPTLARLRDESVSFTMARTPGSQTVYTLTSVFAGTYFSQQYWKRHRAIPHFWPFADETPRFPALLSRAGVRTVTFASKKWLVNEYGVVRGFDEQRIVPGRGAHASAKRLVIAAINRLDAQHGGRLFLYMHFLEPHPPYDQGGKEGSPFERYLAEVAIVDAELGKLRSALERSGAWDRTVLILTADHGEAFGEHGTRFHATSLYEELVRVPLLIRAPRVAPRTVDTPVSLIDLGPTILDLCGQPTPGYVLGQSLAGFLDGKAPALTRPIVAEGRLKKSMVFADGMKLIVDDLKHTEELYDLKADPAEAQNLVDERSEEAARRVAVLRAFFEAHRIRRKGYVIPYRK